LISYGLTEAERACMLGKRKHLNPTEKVYIAGLVHAGNQSYSKIAHQTGVNKTNIIRIAKLFEEDPECKRRPGSGRPRETTITEDRHMLLEVKRDRNITCTEIKDNIDSNVSHWTIVKRLNESKEVVSRWTQAKPWITKENRAKRVKWCKNHLEWTEEDWQKVLFSL